jgi:type IV pilus assembly protein PilO
MATKAIKPEKTKKVSMNINPSGVFKRFSDQFQGINLQQHPATYPVIPRYALLLAVVIAVLALLWVFWLSDLNGQLNAARERENKLRQDYTARLQKAMSLSVLEDQKKEVTRYVDSLERQLPGKNEIDALLSDINQAGLQRNLQFELFKPGDVVLKEYYAELPITLKIVGRYHDISSFAADIAGLSRIVTLGELNLSLADKKHPDQLVLNATARTFRYLDPDEVKAQRNAAAKTKGGRK